jgi:hypothetical protein
VTGRVFLAYPITRDHLPAAIPHVFGSLTTAKRWCESFLGQRPALGLTKWRHGGSTWNLYDGDAGVAWFAVQRRTVKP